MSAPFQRRTAADWQSLVEADLGGPDAFADALVTRTLEGIDVEPLYGDRPDADEPAARLTGGWDIAAEVAHPDPAVANRRALQELEGGATALFVPLDPAGRGTEGVRACRVAELDALLSGVWIDAAPISFGTHAEGVAAAACLEALAAERGVAPEGLQVHVGHDPVATLARDGALPGDLTDAENESAVLASHSRLRLEASRALAVDATVWHAAGADAALELGLACAGFVHALRGLEERGLPPSAAHSEFVWRMNVGRDVFNEIAKLRAARALHARVLGAAGVAEATPLVLHAFTSDRGATERDPWNDMLRSTLGVTASALGGADLVTARPFDAPARGAHEARESSALGRRFARNAQLVLRDECGLGRVGDPTRGSAYVESRTDALARAAWAVFQEVERSGGIAQELRNGRLAERLDAARTGLAAAVSSGARVLVGGTDYLPPEDARHPEPAPLTGLEALDSSRASALEARGRVALGAVETLEHAVRAAAGGATFDEIGGALVRGAPARVGALPRVREEDLAARSVTA
ncbi:MAG: methylmalonyl-CoA mutase family protein [Planctomycetota bacterium]